MRDAFPPYIAEIVLDWIFCSCFVHVHMIYYGHFVMEQSEVAPGVWLPTLYTHDVDGRKFLSNFSIHERTDVTHYRHVGPPSQSIEVIRSELNNLTSAAPRH